MATAHPAVVLSLRPSALTLWRVAAQPIPLIEKAGAGLTAGGLGALVGSPADLTLIRMQSDSTLPAAARRNYKNVGDAMVRYVVAHVVFHNLLRCSMQCNITSVNTGGELVAQHEHTLAFRSVCEQMCT